MAADIFDMHCHLGFYEKPSEAAAELSRLGVSGVCATVTPDEYVMLSNKYQVTDAFRLGVGLHPWWVRDATDADTLCELVDRARFVGEIGLDASPRRASNWGAQLAAFERVCAVCASTSVPPAPKVLSIHAVRAATAALDVLERTGASERCRGVLHWFAGSSDELWRAVRLGCRFSLGERSLATRRGREYARILPADRLLTETDLPESEGARSSASDVVASLERAVSSIAAARKTSVEEVRRIVSANGAELLDV